MKQLKFDQELPVSLEKAWSFFSSPKNLEIITPATINFKILSEVPEKIFPGLLIDYQISILPGIRFSWTTEITEVENEKYFVDEQRKGPYKYWRHEHYFQKTDTGVLMTDKLYYDIGRSFIGWAAGKIFVHQKVNEIFKFRRDMLNKLFAGKSP